MKKMYAIVMMLIFGSSLITAQTVSEEEILSIKSRASEIVFENYVGPITEFSTREEITGIGKFLGDKSHSSPSWGEKYKLFHSFQPEIPEGLDGDILAILEKAGVDHIRNLRMILSGYLQSVYDYNEKQASVLAEFITYYNAIYYKNMDHFRARYKTGVLEYISSENAGLSTHYSEWAGKSRIVIPVSAGKSIGETEAELDTSLISQPEVVEEMQKEEDKALDTRKEMVEIREEEIDKKQEIIDQEQKVLTEEKQTVEEAITEMEKELEAAEEGSPDEVQIKEEIQQLEEKEKEIQEKQEVLKEEQKELDREQDEVIEMREEIAKDENILKSEKSTFEEAAQPEEPSMISSTDAKSLWFVIIEKAGTPASFGSLCQITETGMILKKSELNSVRGNQAIDTGSGIVLIAGKDESSTTVNPVLIDPETLEIKKMSDKTVYAGSNIWTDSSYLYIITRNNSDWVLGKYSYKLDLEGTSETKVNPDSAILFDTETLMIQNTGGTISVLSKEDLSEVFQ